MAQTMAVCGGAPLSHNIAQNTSLRIPKPNLVDLTTLPKKSWTATSKRVSYQSIVNTITTTTTTTTTSNGHLRDGYSEHREEKVKIDPKLSSAVVKPSRGEPVTVEAVITVIQKQRPDVNEQVANFADAVADIMGDKVFLQLVSVEVDPGEIVVSS